MRASLGPVALRCAVLFGVLVFASSPPARADEPEVRTWKDVSGRFKIQARYAGVDGENVNLKKADGSQVQVLLDRLCSADRNYVAEQQKKLAEEDPFKPKPAEDPFQPKPTPGSGHNNGMARKPGTAKPASADAPASPAGGEPFEIQPDWSSAQLAGLPADGEWKVAVGSAGAAPTASASPRLRAVPIPATTDFFEGRKGYVLNAPGTHALVGYTLDNPKPGATRVVLCDLKAGKPLASMKSEGLMAPLALSDAGDQVLMRKDEFGFGNADRLELWNLAGKGVVKVWTMAPHGDAQGPARDVKWAAFLGPKRFATVGGGKLAIWDLDPVRPTTTLQVADGCVPAVSPDGKFLAFAHDGKVGLLDVEAGQVAALQPMPVQHAPWPAFGFSPTGKRFACLAGGKMFVWNSDDGALHRDVQLNPIAVGPNVPPAWSDDDHVLVGDRFLIDVESQVKLWEYQGPEAVVADRDGVCWFLLAARQNQPGALVPARLPQANVQQALKQALADPNFFILRPGATVSIDASGIADGSQRGRVVEALTAKLAEMQVKVAPGAPLVVLPAVEAGKEEEISYRTMGAGFRTDKFKVRPQLSRVKLAYQGQQAWESGSSTLPHFEIAHLGPNESLADHVKKFEKPNYAFFEHVELPRLLARPSPGGSFTLGRSQVSTAGVR
ncbi:SHD1 domain-containing protein [Paludisphaera mucosa]|uniref:SHD1 domain-containing protein n=1 Tax=Paludisphaera mucosa TaxID=3030827 RepID=A0ABT6FCA2_9BACT|nr:SHD1 domain-containing protein [Paludisphaera mucosa]MDG3005126.1 SHD1 domain-containing protein [Paludisphaera mucosa]